MLLDLPDFDSVERAHRIEADRLLDLVDLMVWVLDPQKYADKVVHRQYLAQYAHHRDITVVALNQADRLTRGPVDAGCLDDLRRILAEDGLAGVPVAGHVDGRGPRDRRAAVGAGEGGGQPGPPCCAGWRPTSPRPRTGSRR